MCGGIIIPIINNYNKLIHLFDFSMNDFYIHNYRLDKIRLQI